LIWRPQIDYFAAHFEGVLVRNRSSFLCVLLPSFFLLAAVGAPGLDGMGRYREVFGSDNYYLTVIYSGSPDGLLSQGDQPVRFTGTLVTETGEFRVQGVRRLSSQTFVYEFASDEASYSGRLAKGGCPQFLDLTSSVAGQKREKLRSGSCL
jgi:hypothetical protein